MATLVFLLSMIGGPSPVVVRVAVPPESPAYFMVQYAHRDLDWVFVCDASVRECFTFGMVPAPESSD